MKLRSLKRNLKRISESSYRSCRGKFARSKGRTDATFTKTIGQCLALVPISVLASGLAFALPQNGTIAGGFGSISHNNNEKTTTITQTSPKLVIDWKSFNLAANESVNFDQPSASASVLNRIYDQEKSTIMGSITAQGRVFLANPNGIIFTNKSTINVGSLVATTLDVNNFMADEPYTLGDAGSSAGGAIINRGLITASTGGSVTLVGGSVVNEGIIQATGGYVNLAAGRIAVLDFDGDGLLSFAVDGEVTENTGGAEDAVVNAGTIKAAGGQVLLSGKAAQDVFTKVVNNKGLIQANTIQNRGGVIRLVGGESGIVTNSGTLSAKGDNAGEKGGIVEMFGETVNLSDYGKIDVTGDANGGEALVGGGANLTNVDKDTVIDASSRGKGDGGKVIICADDATRSYGNIEARGGNQGGDGGLVEVSGRNLLDFQGMVDTSASTGMTGKLLLDSSEITIAESTFSPGVGSLLDYATLNQLLDFNAVVVSATNDIVVDASAAITLGDGELTLNSSAGGISFGAATVSGGGILDLNFKTLLDLSADPDFLAMTTVTANGGGNGVIKGSGRTYTMDASIADAGSSDGITWTGVSNLIDTGAGTFIIGGAGSVSGSLTATDGILDYSGHTGAVTFDLANGAGETTGVGTTWTGITSVIGSSNSDTVKGGAVTFVMDDATGDTGSSSGIRWTSFENLFSSGAGIFSTGAAGSVSGSITSVGGTLDYTDHTGAVTFDLANGSGETTGVGTTWNGIATVIGSSNSDTAKGGAVTFVMDAATGDAGSSSGIRWTSFENLLSSGAGIFQTGSAGSVSGRITSVGGTLDYTGHTGAVTFDLANGSGETTGVGTTWTGITNVIGSSNSDTAKGSGATYNLTAANEGNSGAISWKSLEQITDTGTGTISTTGGQTYNLTGAGIGNVTTLLSNGFAGIAHLKDDGAGIFKTGAAGSVSGSITSVGGTLDYTGHTGAVTFDLANSSGETTGVGTTWNGIATVTGSSNGDTVKGGAVTFAMDATTGDAGNSSGIRWTSFENLFSSGAGVFSTGAAGRVSGSITSVGGTLDYTGHAGAVTFDLANGSGETTGVGTIWNGIATVIGSSNSDTVKGSGATYNLTAANEGNSGAISWKSLEHVTDTGTGRISTTGGQTYNLTGAGTGSVTTLLPKGFTGIAHLNDAGAGIFKTGAAGSVSGSITSVGGTLDYMDHTGAVTFDLANGAGETTGVGTTWNGIATVIGSSNSDTVKGGAVTFVMDDATGDAGSSSGIRWTSFENLFSSGAGVFSTGAAGKVSGSITSVGGMLDYTGHTGAVTFDLANSSGETTGVGTTWTGITSVIGSSNSDTVKGGAVTFVMDDATGDTGSSSGIRWTSFENLFSSGAGIFSTGAAGSVSGSITSVGGTLDYTDHTGAVTFDLANGSGETTGVGTTWNGIATVIGSSNSDTAKGGAVTFVMDAATGDAGSSSGIRWTSFENLLSSGAGIFQTGSAGSVSGRITSVGGTLDYTGHTGAVTFDLANGSGETTGVGTTWTGITNVIGSSNSDTAKGSGATYNLTAANEGNSGAISWKSLEQITDTGTGTISTTGGQTYNLTGAGIGNVTTLLSNGFAGIAHLKDDGAGIFKTGAAGSVSGSITSVGGTLDYTGHTGAVTFDLANGSGETTGVGTTWNGLATVIGSSNSDMVKGGAVTFAMDAATGDAGSSSGIRWTSFENLFSTGAGVFSTGAAGRVSGSITSVGGTLDYTDHTDAVTFDLANGSGETTGIGTTWNGITSVIGSSNSDTVKGSGATYNLTAANEGNSGTISWKSLEQITDTGTGTISTTGGQNYNLTGAGIGNVTTLLPNGFTGIAHLNDAGAGIFKTGSGGSVSGSITSVGGTLDYTDHTDAVTFDLANGSGETTGVGTTWSGIATVIGSSNSDTVKGSGATYNLTAANEGNSGAISWKSLEHVTDTGTGRISTTGGQTYNLTGAGTGSVTTLLPNGFTGIAHLKDAGAGIFKTGAAGSLSGSITSVGGTLDYTDHTDAVTFDLANGSGETTGVGTTWSGIATVIGSSNSDTMKGGAVTFAMDAATGDAGSSSGIRWTSFENLFSSGAGIFSTGAAGSVSGSITSVGGTLDYTGHTGAVTFDLANGSGETTGVGTTWNGITTVTGSSNSDTVKGGSVTFAMDAATGDAGSSSGIRWTSFENLFSSGAGIFSTGAAGSVSGSITSVGGTLDYTDHTGAVTFDLANGSGETTGVGTTWNGITSVIGSSNSDTVKGSGATYNLTDANEGNSGTISWKSFEQITDTGTGTISTTGGQNYNLTGAGIGNVTTQLPNGFTGIAHLNDAGAGIFKIGAAGSVSGSITSVGGTLDYTDHTGAVTFDLANGSGETTGIGTTWTGITRVTGSSNSDTVKGSGATYNLTAANEGNSGAISWKSLEQITDTGTGTISTTGGQTYNLTGAGIGNVTTLLPNGFTGIAHLNDAGAGIFKIGAAGSVSGSIISVGGTLDYTDHTGAVTFDLANGSGETTGIGTTWTGITRVTGSSNSDTVKGSGATYNLTAANEGNSGAISWKSLEQITDTGTGTISTTGGQTYNLTGAGIGNVTTLLPNGFTGIAHLKDAGAGIFKIGAAGSVSGSITSVGGTLDYTDHTDAVTFDLANGSGETTGVGTTWTGITSVIGGSNSDTVKGGAVTFAMDASTGDAGSSSGIRWTSFENLFSSGAGIFSTGAAGSVSGSITSVGGTLDYTGHTGAVTFDLANGSGETTGVGTTWNGLATVIGSSNSDMVKGGAVTFAMDAATGDAGSSSGIRWTSFENLFSTGAGVFSTGAAGSVSGSITSVGGTLDYTGHTGAVTFDLANGSGETTGVGTTLTGIASVIGSSNNDTVKGSGATYNLTAANEGNSGAISWKSLEQITDTGTGTISTTGGQTYNLTGAGIGSVTTLLPNGFTGIAHLKDAGAGIFKTGAAGSLSGSITSVGGSLDYTDHTDAVTFDLTNGSGETTGIGTTWTGIVSVIGSSNSDTVKGSGATYNLTAANEGNSGAISWKSLEHVIDTGTGTISTTGGQTYNLTGAGIGNVTTLLPNGFTGIAHLNDAGAGIFKIGAAGSVSGSITSVGGTLDYTDNTGAVTFDLANSSGETTGVGTTWSGIATVIGSSNSDTMKGGAVTFAMDAATGDAGSSSGIRWTSFENLFSSGAGIFSTGAAGSVSGSITSVGGTLDYTNHTGAVTFDLANGSGETTGIGTTWSGITSVIGSSNSDTVKGGAVTFVMDAATEDAGSSGGISWTSFENLFSSGAGVFSTGAAGSVSGSITSVGGMLDYTGHTGAVTFDLANGSGETTGVGKTWNGITSVIGSSNNDTVKGSGATYNLTAANEGNSGAISWKSLEQVADTGTGTISTTGGQTYNLTGAGIGSVTTLLPNGFTGIAHLNDAGAGIFKTGAAGSVSGSITSVGGTLDYTGHTGAVTFDLANGSGETTGVGKTWNGITSVIGSSNNDTVKGSGATYNLTAANEGNSGTISWKSLEQVTDTGTGTISTTGGQTYNLTGAGIGSVTTLLPNGFTGIAHLNDAGAGIYKTGAAGSVSGSITSVGGTLDYTGHTGAVTFDLANGLGVTTGIGTTWNGITSVTGSSNGDTVKGGAVTFAMDATTGDAGNSGGISWTSFENLFSSGAGVFSTGAAGRVSGSITSVGGTLDYTGHTDAVTFDLANGSGVTTGIGTTWSGITSVTGSSYSDTVKGSGATYNLTAANEGNSGTISWKSLEQVTDTGTGTISTTGGQTYNLTGAGIGNVTTLLPNGFTGIAHLNDAGAGIFKTGAAGSLSGSITSVGGTLDYTDHTDAVTFDLANGSGETTGIGTTWTGIVSVIGSSNSDTMKGGAVTFAMDAATGDAGSSSGIRWTSFENLFSSGAGVFSTGAAGRVSGGITSVGGTLDYTGHTGAVIFDLANGSGETTGVGMTWNGITSVIGSSNSDTVIGDAVTFAMDDATGDAGSSSGINWMSFENLFSSGAGVFSTGAAGSVSGSITSVGGTLDYTKHVATVEINKQTSTATGVGGTFSGISNVVGNGTATTLIGVNTGETFTITSANTGTAGSLNFSNVGNLIGGSADDTFILQANGTLTGNVSGGAESTKDILDLSSKTGVVSINQETATATGIGGTFSDIEAVVGNGTNTTLTGMNSGETFNITEANAGIAGSLAFAGVANLEGGTGDNTFNGSGGSLTGSLVVGDGATTTLNGVLNISLMDVYSKEIVINGNINAGLGGVRLEAQTGDIKNPGHWINTTGNLDVITPGWVELNLTKVSGDVSITATDYPVNIINGQILGKTTVISYLTGQTISFANPFLNSVLATLNGNEMNVGYYIDPALFNVNLALFTTKDTGARWPEDQLEEILGSYQIPMWYRMVQNTCPTMGYGNSLQVVASLF